MAKPPEDSNDQLTDEERPTVRIPKYMSGWWGRELVGGRCRVVGTRTDSTACPHTGRRRVCGFARSGVHRAVSRRFRDCGLRNDRHHDPGWRGCSALDIPDEIERIPIRVVIGETSDTTNW